MVKHKTARSLSELDQLPDDALITDPETCSLLYCSPVHLWRGRKSGIYPPPQKYGKMNRTRIGDIRALVRGAA